MGADRYRTAQVAAEQQEEEYEDSSEGGIEESSREVIFAVHGASFQDTDNLATLEVKDGDQSVDVVLCQGRPQAFKTSGPSNARAAGRLPPIRSILRAFYSADDEAAAVLSYEQAYAQFIDDNYKGKVVRVPRRSLNANNFIKTFFPSLIMSRLHT